MIRDRNSKQVRAANAARPRRGLTLVEAVISSLIVATMLVAALNALASSTKAARIQSEKCLGPNLARELMAEVLQARYREPTQTPRFGPEAGERRRSRSAWDDVDDYHGWSASPPQAKDGTKMTNADGWRRQVAVAYVKPSDPSRTTRSDEGLKRITVTVTSPTGRTSTLVALRSDSSIYEEQPPADTTYVSGVGVEIQIGGSDATRVSSGTNILNSIPASP